MPVANGSKTVNNNEIKFGEIVENHKLIILWCSSIGI